MSDIRIVNPADRQWTDRRRSRFDASTSAITASGTTVTAPRPVPVPAPAPRSGRSDPVPAPPPAGSDKELLKTISERLKAKGYNSAAVYYLIDELRRIKDRAKREARVAELLAAKSDKVKSRNERWTEHKKKRDAAKKNKGS